MSGAAEVVYELDPAIASVLGGADVWSDGVRGESTLRWRVLSDTANGARAEGVVLFTPLLREWRQRACDDSSPVLVVEVVGPVARAGRDSWHLSVPMRALSATPTAGAEAEPVAAHVALGGSSGVEMTQRGELLQLRALDGGHHSIGLCRTA